MTEFVLVQVREADGSWAELKDRWQGECEQFGEDFEQYAITAWPVLDELANADKADAGVFALKCDEGKFHAVCQANSTHLPGYTGKVLRIRHLLMAPYYDFGDYSIEEYSAVLAKMFARTIVLSIDRLPSRHIKFHLRSPSDRTIFSIVGERLDGSDIFSSVEVKGAWLYMTKAH